MIYIFICLLSFFLTYLLRAYFINKKLLDHPNERSSHVEAVPRSGGLAIVISFFIGLFYLYSIGEVQKELFYALLSVLPLAIISFLDDLYTLCASLRFYVQMLSASLVIYFIGSDSFLLNVVYFFGILWLINLYNFLDGIDGYAASEAIFVSFASYFIFGDISLLLLGFATLGFLPFNWQKASIFMGDVGSTFLGFCLAVMVIYHSNSFENIAIWLVLLSIFWLDATWTLYRRFVSGQRVTKAHKMHFFQRAVQSGLSHQTVTLYALLLNILSFILIYSLSGTIYQYIVLILYFIFLIYIAKMIDKRVSFR